MAESAYSTARGTEISERSTELVLPVAAASRTHEPARDEPECERKIRVSEPEATQRTAIDGSGSVATGERAPLPPESRGVALPGDRGPRKPDPANQRPSFWRRISLGRRHSRNPEASARSTLPETNPMSDPMQGGGTLANASPAGSAVASTARVTGTGPLPSVTADSIERRIVEPMLQALVSVESKLERSHVELVGRSDQVEQRLTQLWDIEEQLGTLGELQESLLRVSEQQRRLESAILSQNRTLRWLVGAVFLSLAAATFVVVAVLR